MSRVRPRRSARPAAATATAAIASRAATAEALERRLFLSSLTEAEPNGAPGDANIVAISTAEPTIVHATMGHTDLDYFKFTLPSRSGVFLDIDARELGIAGVLDTRLTLFAADGTTVVAQNDDGRDFDTLVLAETEDTQLEFGDSALYADLSAGTYVLQVHSWANALDPVEPYQLKITANATFTSSVPVFNSLAGAADTIYLDFDGHSATDAWGTYVIPAFDLSGNAAEWTPGERAAIETTWRVVADAFSPFKINVTTSYGGGYADGVAHRQVIGNADGSEVGAAGRRGLAWFGGYAGGGATRKTAFTFADNFADTFADAGVSGEIVTDAIEIGNASVHEIGHALGLEHYLDEAHRDAFMYTPDFGLNRARWRSGSNEVGQPQDDIAVIAGAANTFGYRADDVPSAGITLTPSGNNYAAAGVIGQIDDVDTFHFSGSGATQITLDIGEHWGHLDGRISLHDVGGALLAAHDDVNRLGAAINFTLPAAAAGNYFVRVTSNGGEGEVGQYTLRITTTTTPGSGALIAGRTFRDTNYNGVYETALGDTASGDVVVYLDANANAVLDADERSTTSSAIDGTYSFTNVAAGTYTVRQVTPAGHVNGQAYPRVVTSAGEQFAGVDFGSFPTVYNGTGGNDTFTVRRGSGDPSRLEILASATPGITWSAPRAIIESLTIFGHSGDDQLAVDYAAGDPAPAGGGILIDGGASATFNGNRVSIIGSGGADSVLLNHRGIAAPGTIALLAITGVSVDLLGGADVLRYATGDADDAVTLGANTISDGDLTVVYARTENLVIDAGAGNDTLTIDAAPNAPVAFHGGLDPAAADRLVVNSGNYAFNSDAQAQTANMEVVVNAGGAVTFNSTQHLRRLEINGGFGVVPTNGERVIWTDTVSLTGAGRLDLRDNDLIVRNGGIGTFNAPPGAYDGVTGFVASAYNYGAWDLPGVATTMPDAVERGVTTLCVARVGDIYGIDPAATEIYRGETVTGAAVVVKYSYVGDLNLDGLIDGADYGTIDNYVQFPGTSGYQNGDFNFDGVIDGADYGLIDNSIQLQGEAL